MAMGIAFLRFSVPTKSSFYMQDNVLVAAYAGGWDADTRDE